jgi:hypothetical protein
MDFADSSTVWVRRRVTFTPEASAFLALLRRLGHLDDARFAALLDELSPACEGFEDEPLVLDRDATRRLAAGWLFRLQTQLPQDQLVLLAREWPLLFG